MLLEKCKIVGGCFRRRLPSRARSKLGAKAEMDAREIKAEALVKRLQVTLRLNDGTDYGVTWNNSNGYSDVKEVRDSKLAGKLL